MGGEHRQVLPDLLRGRAEEAGAEEGQRRTAGRQEQARSNQIENYRESL